MCACTETLSMEIFLDKMTALMDACEKISSQCKSEMEEVVL